MTAVITPAQAADRIEAFAREGRLVQDIWHGERRGREVACLLGAIDERINDRRACPASVMPAWVAHVLPDLHDNVTAWLVGPLGLRFARALRRTQDWPTEPGGTEACRKWRSVRAAWVGACVVRAMDAAHPACDGAAWWPEAAAVAMAAIAALHGGEPVASRVAREVTRGLGGIARSLEGDMYATVAGLVVWATIDDDEAPRRVAERAVDLGGRAWVELGEQEWAVSAGVWRPAPSPTWTDLYRALLDAMEAEA